MEFLAQWLMWYLWNWIVRKWCNFSREPNLIVFRFKYFSHLSGGKLLNPYGIFLSSSKHYRVNTKSTWTSVEDPDVEGVEYGPGKSWAQPTPWWETLSPSQFVQWYFCFGGWCATYNIMAEYYNGYPHWLLVLQDPWVRENLTYSFDKCVLWE